MNSITCDVMSVWNDTMEKLKTVSETAYTGWFSKTTPLAIVDNTIKIGVPDDFFRDWLSEHYSDLLRDSLKACSYSLDFEFIEGYPARSEKDTVQAPPKQKSDDLQGLLFADDPLFAEPAIQEQPIAAEPEAAAPVAAPAPKKVVGININTLSMHTFQTFIAGEENRYAYETIKSVALNPGAIYNPLYIYGGTGVGKTHLLQAVANEAISHNPSLSIRYATCEELLNEFVELVKDHKNMYDFRSAMRNVDIFLVDDVHVLGKSPRLQEEFFNTFNTLYNGRKQIILTSDKQPCEIEGLEERLVSRFESGLTQEINAPEFATRLAILRAIRGDNSVKVKISDSVLEFIANHITSSVRRLKGAFIRVTAYANMHKDTKITIEHAEKLLANLIAKEVIAKTIYIDDIQRAVAQHFNIKISDLLGNARPKNIAEPRMAAMYLSRKLTGHSLPEIGSSFGKNHATVINAIKKIPEICEKSENFRRNLEQIERQLTRH